MEVIVSKDYTELGQKAGKAAAALIMETIATRGQANIIMATGASQFETIKQLLAETGIDWSKVVMFHLDEYIGLPESSPASFRKYLKERFLQQASPLKASYLINGETDPVAECSRVGALIQHHPIDVALVGIGENGHLAFNDPPADFDTEAPYLVVNLDDQCRAQQYAEGWFESMDAVPHQAISMSINQILKSTHIICSVPDSRKANAVRDCLEKNISNLHPASILQSHSDCRCFLDEASASELTRELG